jgi:hypothetical protein
MTDFEKADVNDMPLETSYTGTIWHPHINNTNVTTKWTSEVGAPLVLFRIRYEVCVVTGIW